MNALGLIENKSYLASVVAADIALKTANVQLLNMEIIKGGYVTVQLIGDVGAVKAAVEAGTEAVEDFGTLISSHVIPRTAKETEKLLKNTAKSSVPKESPSEKNAPVKLAQITKKLAVQAPKEKQIPTVYVREDLQKMTVTELRKLVRKRKVMSDDIKSIKYAKKLELIESLLATEKQKSEEKSIANPKSN